MILCATPNYRSGRNQGLFESLTQRVFGKKNGANMVRAGLN
jgi:hypothetical protein